MSKEGIWPDQQKNEDQQKEQKFRKFLELIYQANSVTNLTRVPEEKAYELHILDSLSLSRVLVPKAGQTICDLGTGAGLPGIPLAIQYPEVKITVIESIGKKLNFVQMAVEQLELDNVECLNVRAEAVKKKFDIVVARAVAPLQRLVPMLEKLVKPNGFFVAYKGPNVDQELVALPEFEPLQIERFGIGDSERVLIVGR